ncbi:hypothetical protein [Lactobacillus sp.]|nr:hypothetical protein [Lactobacillus sp.]MBD5429444.1 hypothetical protein [Lactobacillus sp.]
MNTDNKKVNQTFKIVTPSDNSNVGICGPDGCVIDWDRLAKENNNA